MKLIIDIDEELYKAYKGRPPMLGDGGMDMIVRAVANGIPYDERPQGDLISRDALKKAICIDEPISIDETWEQLYDAVVKAIDNAPTISDRYAEGYAQGYIDGSTGADMKGGAE